MEFLTHLHVYHTFDASISMDLRLQCLTSRIYRFPCPVNVTIWRKWIFCKLLGYILTMLYINWATLERFNPYGVNYISVELGIGITIASIQKLLPFPFFFHSIFSLPLFLPPILALSFSIGAFHFVCFNKQTQSWLIHRFITLFQYTPLWLLLYYIMFFM